MINFLEKKLCFPCLILHCSKICSINTCPFETHILLTKLEKFQSNKDISAFSLTFNSKESLTSFFLNNQSYPMQLQRKIRGVWQYQTRLKDI